MKITVVTVVYNCEDTIEQTMLSVTKQTYGDIEYLVIDGKSTDRTMDIVKSFGKSHKFIKFISEPDGGIYDAMNKGIRMASGEYIIFLNSGDMFVDYSIVERIALILNDKKPDILYGDSIEVFLNSEEKIRKYDQSLNFKYFIKGNGLCHQSVFAKASLLKNRSFDCSYKLAADKDWIIYEYNSKKYFLYVDIPICRYDRGGISSQSENASLLKKETNQIIIKRYKIGYFVVLLRKIKKIFVR